MPCPRSPVTCLVCYCSWAPNWLILLGTQEPTKQIASLGLVQSAVPCWHRTSASWLPAAPLFREPPLSARAPSLCPAVASWGYSRLQQVGICAWTNDAGVPCSLGFEVGELSYSNFLTSTVRGFDESGCCLARCCELLL